MSLGYPAGWCARTETPSGKVAVVVGGGAGHYPAFCGVVGPGFADGAVVGNIFTSPSATDAASVARAAHGDAGVLLLTGNYAGDVMNFGLAVQADCAAKDRRSLPGGHRRHRQRAAGGHHQASRYRRRFRGIPVRQCGSRSGRGPRRRRTDRRQGQRLDPHARRGLRRLHDARCRPAAVHRARGHHGAGTGNPRRAGRRRATPCPRPPNWRRFS